MASISSPTSESSQNTPNTIKPIPEIAVARIRELYFCLQQMILVWMYSVNLPDVKEGANDRDLGRSY